MTEEQSPEVPWRKTERSLVTLAQGPGPDAARLKRILATRDKKREDIQAAYNKMHVAKTEFDKKARECAKAEKKFEATRRDWDHERRIFVALTRDANNVAFEVTGLPTPQGRDANAAANAEAAAKALKATPRDSADTTPRN